MCTLALCSATVPGGLNPCRVTLPAGSGLTNQIYSHLNALMMAREMGAELVLAPALYRGSFASRMGNVSWAVADIDTIFDLEQMVPYWKNRGVILHQVRTPGCAAG